VSFNVESEFVGHTITAGGESLTGGLNLHPELLSVSQRGPKTLLGSRWPGPGFRGSKCGGLETAPGVELMRAGS
jgi:hypothetical protein